MVRIHHTYNLRLCGYCIPFQWTDRTHTHTHTHTLRIHHTYNLRGAHTHKRWHLKHTTAHTYIKQRGTCVPNTDMGILCLSAKNKETKNKETKNEETKNKETKNKETKNKEIHVATMPWHLNESCHTHERVISHTMPCRNNALASIQLHLRALKGQLVTEP